MKRSGPIVRKTPLRAKRSTPRRRPAPRYSRDEWEEANMILAARSGGLCEICAKEPWTERHHRKRRRDGGDRLANLLGLCSPCHRFVTEHPANARRYGWIVSVTSDPAMIPVLHRRQTWLLLDDGGGMVDAFVSSGDAPEYE